MKLSIFAMILALSITACNLEMLYSIKALNDKYCAETNAENRARIIELIRNKKPDYPEHGLCGFEEKVMDRVA